MNKFKCICGNKHKFSDCDAIQTYWLRRGDGHCRGNQWLPGELRIICPVDLRENRILFSNDYDERRADKFRYRYSDKFKSITNRDDKEWSFHSKDNNWVNNDYIYKNHEKYGL